MFTFQSKWAAGAVALAALSFSGSVLAAPASAPIQLVQWQRWSPAADLQIPRDFTVTTDVNNALKGTVFLSGVPTTLDVIVPPGGYDGQTSGVVYDTGGTDVTSSLGPEIVSHVVAAYVRAANNEGISSAYTGGAYSGEQY